MDFSLSCTIVTFHGIYIVPAEILYHWCQLCTSGPPLDVACSVVIVISSGLFAGLWACPL